MERKRGGGRPPCHKHKQRQQRGQDRGWSWQHRGRSLWHWPPPLPRSYGLSQRANPSAPTLLFPSLQNRLNSGANKHNSTLSLLLYVPLPLQGRGNPASLSQGFQDFDLHSGAPVSRVNSHLHPPCHLPHWEFSNTEGWRA